MDITIETILAKIDDTVDQSGGVRTFGIRYLKKGGAIGERLHVRKGVKPTQKLEDSPLQGGMSEGQGGSHPRGKLKYNLKQHGVIKLYDVDQDEFRDIKVSAIFGFRDYQSDQWLNRRAHGK